MVMLWFFVGKSLYCTILEIDYGWFIWILLYGFRLSTEYQKFKVDSAHWNSWSEETQRSRVKKLCD